MERLGYIMADTTNYTKIFADMYGNNGTNFGDGLRTGDFAISGADGISRGLPVNNAIFFKMTVRNWLPYELIPASTPFQITNTPNVIQYYPLANRAVAGFTSLEFINGTYALALADPVVMPFTSDLAGLEVIISGYDQYKNKVVTGGATNEAELFIGRPIKWITSVGFRANGVANEVNSTPINAFELPYTDYGWMAPVLTVNGNYYSEKSNASTTTPGQIRLIQGDFLQANFENPIPGLAYLYARWVDNPVTQANGLVRPVIYFGAASIPTTTYINGICAVYGYGTAPQFAPIMIENQNAPYISKYPLPVQNSPDKKSNQNIIGIPQFAGDATYPWAAWKG